MEGRFRNSQAVHASKMDPIMVPEVLNLILHKLYPEMFMFRIAAVFVCNDPPDIVICNIIPNEDVWG